MAGLAPKATFVALAHAVRTPRQIAWAKLRQHPLAGYGALVLAVLYFGALFADTLAPYDFETQFRTKTWHRPSVVRWKHADGRLSRPYVYNTVRVKDEAGQAHYVEVSPQNMAYLQRKLGALLTEEPKENPIRLFPKADPHRFLGLIPMERRLIGIDAPERSNRPAFFLLGSDYLGRDTLSRLLYGSRISLSIGLMGVSITFTLGMLIGGISGYFRGWTDIGIQRLIEMIMLLPGFYIMLALRASIPPGVDQITLYFAIVFILAFIGWAGLARTIRGYVLSIAQNDYIVASQALGQRRLILIVRHVLPQTFSYVIASITMAIPGYMLGESGLSFIGLGIQEPYSSWGNMLQSARNVNDIKLHPWVLAPGFLIFLTVVAFQFLGDGLRDAFDPKTVLHAKKEAA